MRTVTSRRRLEAAYASPSAAQYLAVLWKRRYLVATVSVVCGVIGLAVGLTANPVYEAHSTVLIFTPKFGDTSSPVPVISTANFEPIIESRGQIAKLIKEFHLDEPPMRLTPDRFVADALSVEEVRQTNLIRIKVRLSDPVLASRVLNRLLDLALEFNRQLSQRESVFARDFIKIEVEQARARRDDLQNKLITLEKSAQLDLVKRDVETLLLQRADLHKVLVDIEAQRGELAAAQELIAARKPILTLRRALDRNATMLEAARASSDSTSLLDMQLRDEVPDSGYEQLDWLISNGRARLASLESQRNELVNKSGVGRQELKKLTELYRSEIDLEALKAEYDITNKVYADLTTRYEQARIQVTSRSAELQIVDPAFPPERPTSWRPTLLIAVTFAGGLFLSLVGVIVWEHVAGRFAAQRA